MKARRKDKEKAPKPASANSRAFGAGGRGRTDTVLPPRDFESRTSANSITPARSFYWIVLLNIAYWAIECNLPFMQQRMIGYDIIICGMIII
jgi:hypothetical protein